MKDKNQGLESIGSILISGKEIIDWKETRGTKQKYFFYEMQRGEIRKKIVNPKSARNIQNGMKASANRQGIAVTIQNHKTYLLIKRTK
jgi:hypothetical protein